MKKVIASVVLSIASLAAWGSSLSVINGSTVNFTGYNGQPASITGAYSTGQLGALSADVAGKLEVTYLGQESGYINNFWFLPQSNGGLAETNLPGKTISMNINPGVIGFEFTDNHSALVINGNGSNTGWASFAILAGKTINPYGAFDYILGFNDGYIGDADFDDFVVGVRLSPVPLPAAAWLFGSALLGFIGVSTRRRV